MKTHVLFTALTSLALLSACNVAEAEKNRLEALEAANDVSKMDVPQLINFVDTESKFLTASLKTIIDRPSAEAALVDIQETRPRLNTALSSLADVDPESLDLSIGTMRKMLTITKSQSELLEQIKRVSQIPEARNVLKAEFDKLTIIGQ